MNSVRNTAAIIACLLLIACASDKHLTRDRASALITTSLSGIHPYVEVIIDTVPLGANPIQDPMAFDKYLASQGLLHEVNQSSPGAEPEYELTPKGREIAASQHWYAANANRYQIVVGDYHFAGVTGIQQPDATRAVVKYTYETVPNDFGKSLMAVKNGSLSVRDPLAENTQLLILGITGTAATVLGKQFDGQTQMTLYDDGWRVGN